MSESNIILFHGDTTLDIPCERVLQGAQEAKLKTVLVIGWDENDEMYAACSSGDNRETMWLLKKFEKELLGE
jgi:hypothetical protein